MKKVLFIDRDGTIIQEMPPTYQIDAIEKLRFYPGMFQWLGRIAREMDYELVMVSNQDGLGTDSFPREHFQPIHDLIMDSLKGEGIIFTAEHIDESFAQDDKPTRKPGIGMLMKY